MRQISRLDGRKLERIGDLAFDHQWGTCSVMNNQLYLCFNAASENDYNRCRQSTGPLETFSEIPVSNYAHRKARTATTDSKSLCLIK